jgi:16S rRNA (guanine966-N2)-methyltransferase
MASSTNTVRIIGGKWKRRKLTFPDSPGLRPTMDRARETLFNWLAPHIHDAKCLDLFSGSGALGFEALSRGADHATLVDQNPAIIRALQANRKMLFSNPSQAQCSNEPCTIIQSSAPGWLHTQNQHWDIIFVDPPFTGPLMNQTLQILQTGDYTEKGALIYLETPQPLETMPGWNLIKNSKVGGTHLNLIALK